MFIEYLPKVGLQREALYNMISEQSIILLVITEGTNMLPYLKWPPHLTIARKCACSYRLTLIFDECVLLLFPKCLNKLHSTCIKNVIKIK